MVGKHSKRHKAERQHRAKPNWSLYAVMLLGTGLVISVISLVAQQITQAPPKTQTTKTQLATSSQSQTRKKSSAKHITSQTTKSSVKKTSTKTSQTTKPKKQSSSSTSRSKKQRTTASQSTATKAWLKQETAVKVPILKYQEIREITHEEGQKAYPIVSPETFESHIKALSEAGYYFLTPEEAYRVFTTNEIPAKKIVWLTFDGGYRDFYTQAYPILKKYKAKATSNLVINPIITDLPNSLSLDQILELKTQGMSFQSQSLSNSNLAISYPEAQANELAVSKSWLDNELNQDTLVFTYPSGQYSPETVTFATQNYKLALTDNTGIAQADNGLLTLSRLTILPTTTADDLLASIR